MPRFPAVLIFAFALALIGFARPAPAAAQEGGVVATIKPLHSLVAGVMRGTGEPELLLDGNVSPHDFQLKPSQVRKLRRSDVVFYIDDHFETFLQGALAVLPERARKPVAQGAGLLLLPVRRGGAWPPHEHAHEHAHEHGHEPGSDDMHVWLDPENARRIVFFVAETLGERYPAHRAAYRANAKDLAQRLEALDAALRAELAGVKAKPFLVFHDAYQYFERRYGLRGAGSLTLEPDEAPSPSRIRQAQAGIREDGVACVFREPQFSDKLIRTVTEGSGARAGILDPLGAGIENGPELYFTAMQNLAGNLKHCLSGK